MATSSTFRMADRLLDGRLADLLAEYKAQGVIAEDIARRLYAEAGIEVSGQTVRRWLERVAA